VVVYYWKVDEPVRVPRHYSLVDPAQESDPVREQAWFQVWVPERTIFSIVQIDPSDPIIGELWLQVLKIIEEHTGSFFIVINEEDPLVSC
jgi:hypothetical protein